MYVAAVITVVKCLLWCLIAAVAVVVNVSLFLLLLLLLYVCNFYCRVAVVTIAVVIFAIVLFELGFPFVRDSANTNTNFHIFLHLGEACDS